METLVEVDEQILNSLMRSWSDKKLSPIRKTKLKENIPMENKFFDGEKPII